MEHKAADKKVFSWTLWKFDIDIEKMPKGEQTISPMARVITSDGYIQNGKIEEQLNARGLLNNTPHTIDIKVIKD